MSVRSGSSVTYSTGTPNGRSQFPPGAVARDVGSLAHDAIELSELQFDLFKVELRQAALGLFGPLVLFFIAGMTVLASLPLLLFFVATGLIEWANWEEGYAPWAYLAAFGIGALLAATVGFVGWSVLKRKLNLFRTSREELSRNIEWMKSALRAGR
ncbi:MAG TPA: phage holin family protein [Pirellulaceae bacterium]|nr:phage holin family protein [Pirellulaceae bacterium]